MSTGGVKEVVLAKVYAAAILKLGQEGKQPGLVEEELRNLADILDNDATFTAFLDSPTVDNHARQLTIEKLFRGKYSDLVVDALQVLNRNERLGLVREVATAYHELLEEATGRVEVFVRTASGLTDELRTRLRDKLAHLIGKQIDLVERIDESLIGGLVAQVGDHKYDTSVRRKLRDVGMLLLDRASQEIHRGTTTIAT